jgi:hypothetical protein
MAHRPAGLDENPWATATIGSVSVYAILWRHQSPYLSVNPLATSEGNKILWLVDGVAASAVTIRAHPENEPTPLVMVGQPFDQELPSTVDLPSDGCWVFDVAAGTSHGILGLTVGP